MFYLGVAALGLPGLGAMGAYAQSSHHGHEEPAPGPYARAVAAYTPPDVALVDQHGAAVSLHEGLQAPQNFSLFKLCSKATSGFCMILLIRCCLQIGDS